MAEDGQRGHVIAAGLADQVGHVGGERGRDEAACRKQAERVGAEPVAEVLEGGSQKHVMGNGTERGGVQSEMGEIVPSGGGDPGVFALGRLSADEAGWVGDAEGSDGSDVEEKRIIDGFGDKTVANLLFEILGGWDENSERGSERDGVLVGEEGGQAALNKNGVERAPGFKAGDGEGERGGCNGGGLEPVESGHGLGVRKRRVVF
jgi:hypothetical protein